MGQTIGTSNRYSTWAVLRSPMWKGSGLRGQPTGVNKNKGKVSSTGIVGFNMVYPENLGKFAVAFPFIGEAFASGFDEGWGSSMCLGLTYIIDQIGNDEDDIPYILSFYLSHGQGTQQRLPSRLEVVVNGYTYGPAMSSGRMGYDTLRTRDQYRGAVVNLTFTPGPSMSEVTTNVTITDDLFPDNLDWPVNLSNGIFIGTYTWPVPSGSLTWDQPYWTINSLTMP